MGRPSGAGGRECGPLCVESGGDTDVEPELGPELGPEPGFECDEVDEDCGGPGGLPGGPGPLLGLLRVNRPMNLNMLGPGFHSVPAMRSALNFRFRSR